MIRLLSLVSVAALVVGCGSAPDSIDVTSVNDGVEDKTPLRPTHTMKAGDILVLEGAAKDDGEATGLCIHATSTDPAVVRVRPIRDRECSVFLVEAKSVGHASVSFEARGRTRTTDIEVTPGAAP